MEVGGCEAPIPQKLEDFYTILEERHEHRRTYSFNYRAKQNSDGKLCRIKKIEKSVIMPNKFKTQMDAWKTVKHPNLIALYDYFEDDKYYYLVTEVEENETLLSKVANVETPLTENNISKIIRATLEVIVLANDHNLMVENLSPHHIHAADPQNNELTLRIDIGLDRLIDFSKILHCNTKTPIFIPPEILCAKPFNTNSQSWVVGVITYLLLCGFPPFFDENIPRLFESIICAQFDYPPEYFDVISDKAIEFIDSLLIADSALRGDPTTILHHQWLNEENPSIPLTSAQLHLQSYISNNYYYNSNEPDL